MLERRIIIFKTIAISKIVYLTFLTVIPNSLIEGLQKIQITFIWQSSRPNISHKTLCNNFLNGGLKHIDISSKIISLQCSWLRKLCDDDSLFASSELPSCILSNFLWLNKHILIGKSPFFVIFVAKAFATNYLVTMEMLNLETIKEEFGFSNISNFKWQQPIFALPPFWKKIIKETDHADNLLLPNHYLI